MKTIIISFFLGLLAAYIGLAFAFFFDFGGDYALGMGAFLSVLISVCTGIIINKLNKIK